MKRLKRTARRDQLLTVAIGLAQPGGKSYREITPSDVAAASGVSSQWVHQCLGPTQKMQRAIVRAAICRGDLHIIAQAIVMADPQVRDLDPALRARALEVINYDA